MPNAKNILEVAEAQIGVKATNYRVCKYNTWFYGHKVSGDEYHWCAVFVCWVFNQAKALRLLGANVDTASSMPADLGLYASCGYLAKGVLDRGQLIKPKSMSAGLSQSQVKVGDVVFFHWSNEASTLLPGTYVSDHVGIIEKLNPDGSIQTIEGNTGDSTNGQVLRRTHYMNVVSCVGRPKYSDTPEKLTEAVMMKFYYVGKNYGTPSGQVKTVQRLLNWLGYKDKNGKELAVDGICGNNTEYAINVYKKKHNLTVNGIVDDKMWKLITAGK